MTNKMTYVKALEIAMKAVEDNKEVTEKLEALKESISKKNSAERKPTATQKANEEYKKAINNTYLSDYKLLADDVVMYSPVNFEDLDSALDYRTEETALSNLLADSLLYMYNNSIESPEKAVVAVIPTGLIRDTIYKGNITVSDVFLINSLGNGKDGKAGYPLCDFYISGKEIIRAAEVAVSLSPFMRSANLQF